MLSSFALLATITISSSTTILTFCTATSCSLLTNRTQQTFTLIVACNVGRTSNLTLRTCFFSFEMLMFSWRAWKTIRCASLLIHRLRSFECSFFFFFDEHIHNCSSPKTIHRKDSSSAIHFLSCSYSTCVFVLF